MERSIKVLEAGTLAEKLAGQPKAQSIHFIQWESTVKMFRPGFLLLFLLGLMARRRLWEQVN